ncbi:MAG: short-chain fatty acyl-CoA regulator family protein [Alphaproteobacteria bacterium]|nr:short-chain fatty acyl-CoA regulator family protein [Alphaproteobacteria bacterium]
MASTVTYGHQVRRLRREKGLTQSAMAGLLGISPSYLNLIEHNHRPLTRPLMAEAAYLFGVAPDAFSDDSEARILGDLVEMFGDRLFADQEIDQKEIAGLVHVSPAACQAIVGLYRAYRTANDNVGALSERLSGDAFVSSSIHELLTLLTSIRSFSEILHDHDDLDADERRRFLGIVLEESKRLTEAVGQLVGLARGDALEAIVGSRSPAEEVTRFIERSGNHFPELESEAEALNGALRLVPGAGYPVLADQLKRRFGVTIDRVPASDTSIAERYDAASRRLIFEETLPPRRVSFRLAQRLALLGFGELLDRCIEDEEFLNPETTTLARRALASYFAAALLMPYGPFAAAATETRYDIELLQQRFGASFEQICHRLTTLRRAGAAGIAFHFLRVDPAGNISKHFRGSGLSIPRFGSACSLWAVHAAYMTPGRIHCQLSELPDGSAYFSIARTITKPGGGFDAPKSHFAIEIGCEASRAGELVYTDGLALGTSARRVPIGVTCRLCERSGCRQRAQPLLLLSPAHASSRA